MTELTAKERDLLQRIDAKEDLRPLFFSKVNGIRWFDELEKREYFAAEDNPAPTPPDEEGYIRIPTWRITDYLVKTAPELASVRETVYPEKFLSILTSTTEHARKKGFSNHRTWWRFAEILRHIPTAAIDVDDLDMIDYWLEDKYERGLVAQEIGEKWLPALLVGQEHEQKLAVRTLELIFAVKFIDRDFAGRTRRDAILRIDHHYSEKIVEAVAELAGQTVGAEALSVFNQYLRSILDELDNDSWSSLWQPAIEDHSQNRYHEDAENTLVKAFRDSLKGFLSSDQESGFEYVSRLLDSEYDTIKRIAIHAINNNFRLCSELVDRLLAPHFLNDNYRHEMWQLLNQRYGQFTGKQRGDTLALISTISRSDENGITHPTATAYSQASWLAAIRDFGNTESELYNEKVRIAGAEPDHPSFSSYTSGGTVVHESPYTVEDLQSMDIDRLVESLGQYDDQNSNFMEPGIEGLSRALKQVVKTTPIRFYAHLPSFLSADLAYIHQVIAAYEELWREKEKLPWDDIWAALLEFCNRLVDRDEFWSEENARERATFIANRFWVVSAIARLIEAGTKSDEHAFDAKHLPLAEKVIGVLLKRESGSDFSNESDAVAVAINSPRGQALEALINIALRSCRIADRSATKEHSEAWSHFQPYFDSELDRAELPEYEFATLITNYLPNFLYMSSDWTLGNLDRVFDSRDDVWWRCAVQGYTYVGTVYQQLFTYLKEHGHLVRALDDPFLRDSIRERVVQNIGVAYLSGFENLADSDSLISVLISRGNLEELRQLIWLVWTTRRKDDQIYRQRVFELWPVLLEHADTSTLEGKRLASHLCHWAVFIDSVDDTSRELLLAVAPYADVVHNSYELLESLARISRTQPFEAHGVWMRLLDGSTPDYPEEAIREMLANLVQEGADGLRKAKEAVSVYIKSANEKPAKWLSQIVDHGKAKEGILDT